MVHSFLPTENIYRSTITEASESPLLIKSFKYTKIIQKQATHKGYPVGVTQPKGTQPLSGLGNSILNEMV